MIIRFLILLFLLICQPLHPETPVYPKCFSNHLGWDSKEYRPALDFLLPGLSSKSFVDSNWIVNVRILPSFDPEYQFSIVMSRNGRFTVSSATPKVSSIYSVLPQLRLEHPDPPLNELSSKIEIKRWTVSDHDNAELRALVTELTSIELKQIPPKPDVICLDGTGYEFEMEALSNSNRIEIGCYAGKTPALISWTEKVRRVLNGYTAQDYELIKRLQKGNVEKALQLIRNGANACAINENGVSAFIAAAGLNNIELLKTMISANCPHHGLNEALIFAASQLRVISVRELLKTKIDVNYQNERGETALIAAASLFEEALPFIHRSDLDLIEMAQSLIGAGADLNKQDNCGNTALMQAIDSSNYEVARILLSSGADLTMTNAEGRTAADLARNKSDSRFKQLFE